MANNSIALNWTNQSYPQTFVGEHVLYASIGTMVFVSNSMIIAAWAMKKALRAKKEMVLIAALAIAEAIFGLGHLFAAIDRFPYYLQNEFEKVTDLECFFRIHSVLWTFGALGSGSMQLVISIDRFVAVSWFTTYMGYGRSYSIKLACYTGIWVVLLFFLFFLDMYINQRDHMDLPVCWDFTRFTNYGYNIYWAYLLLASLAACSTYLVVMWKLKRQAKSNALQATNQQVQFSYQARVTKLLSIVTLCTGLLFVSPCILYYAMRYRVVSRWIGRNVVNLNPLTTALVCVMSLNSSVNIVIYFVKNAELRHAIMDLLCIPRCQNTITTATSDVTPVNAAEATSNGEYKPRDRRSQQLKQIIPMVNLNG